MPFSLLIIPHLKVAQSGKWSLKWRSQDEAMLFCQKNSPSLNKSWALFCVVYAMRLYMHIKPQVQISNLRFDHLIKRDIFFKAQKAGSDLLSFHIQLPVGNSDTWRTFTRGQICACNINFHMYRLLNAWCCKCGSTDWKPHLKCNIFQIYLCL